MKRIFRRMSGLLAAGALFVGLAGGASAAVYTVDTLLGSANISSGDATELQKLAEFAGVPASSLTLDYKGLGLVATRDDANSWYLDIAPDTPGFFLLKFGGGGDWDSHYFFTNIGELTKLVWTDAQIDDAMGSLSSPNVGKLSHYNYYNSGSTNIPAPATLALLGLGALGLGLARRRKQQS